MKLIRIMLTAGMVFLLSISLACAKPFGGHTDGKGVFVGEVSCYGEHEIQPQFLDAFRETIGEGFQEMQSKGKIHLVDNGNWMLNNSGTAEDAVLAHIHMDAIAYGPLFQKDSAGAKMIRYAEGVFGEDYFWDEQKLAARKAGAKKPYRISQAMTEAAREIGLKYGADYIFYCNLMEADIELATSIFNSEVSNEDERAKHIKLDAYYYLVDIKTGLVYEGRVAMEKTARLQDLFGTYGKAMNSETLLHAVFDKQAKKIVKDALRNGQKALEKAM